MANQCIVTSESTEMSLCAWPGDSRAYWLPAESFGTRGRVWVLHQAGRAPHLELGLNHSFQRINPLLGCEKPILSQVSCLTQGFPCAFGTLQAWELAYIA